MKNRITLLSLLVLFAVFAVGVVPTRSTSVFAAGGNGPSANGHGNLTVGGELRTFSFHAITQRDDDVQGSVTLHNRSTDTFTKADINCLRVVGNTAIMSGPITNSSNPVFEGRTAIFRVQDNGEGANSPPDGLSLLFIFPAGSTASCNINFVFPFMPIEGGNVQVKP